ncbi:TIR domain-containing protein [Flexibacter flexilis DSM 6793]|uniref:TIR domain-containing protein n=1 Tax=Flexibacter flexilis DSM 6793 TaxID=927664 RepID=A0A1I1N9W0_9BACT|nr:TIR domain-containing protein [Flexibacter flexilis]SFC94419.1 TIR domain-containing protein [Flexibacter flexilis DSM 6793]
MRIFISWSGDVSKQIGEAIKDWLPAVLQNVKPYFTPNDIEKGARWNADISKELEHCKLGIFIYTKDNIDSQWMLFEAGAISKMLDNSKVCPILFGLDNADFKGPLTQFQTSQFQKTDFRKLVYSINNSLSEQKLEEKVLDEVFEMWWPKLENKVNKLLDANKVENIAVRNDRELLEEILAISRITAKRTIETGKSNSKRRYNTEVYEKLVSSFIFGTETIFEIDWEHTKSCLEGDNLQYFVAQNGDFLNPNVNDEGNNWANRVGFLESYRKLKSFIEEYGLRKRDSYFDPENEPPF